MIDQFAYGFTVTIKTFSPVIYCALKTKINYCEITSQILFY